MPAEPPPIHGNLGFLLMRLHGAVRESLTAALAAENLAPPEWGVLALVRAGAATPAALADGMGTSRAFVTRLLDCLEGKGHVERAANPADGRSVLVTLTESGAAVEARCAAISDAVNRAATAGLSASERARLGALLAVAVAALPARGCAAGPA